MAFSCGKGNLKHPAEAAETVIGFAVPDLRKQSTDTFDTNDGNVLLAVTHWMMNGR